MTTCSFCSHTLIQASAIVTAENLWSDPFWSFLYSKAHAFVALVLLKSEVELRGRKKRLKHYDFLLRSRYLPEIQYTN